MAKTEPSGIRFDEDNLMLAMLHSGKKTKQGLVDFLLYEYCRMFKIETKPVFQGVVAESKVSQLPNAPAEEMEEEKPVEPAYDTPYFRRLFFEAQTKEELERAVKLMLTKITGKWSQDQLKAYAEEIYKQRFDF